MYSKEGLLGLGSKTNTFLEFRAELEKVRDGNASMPNSSHNKIP